jgi:hypothetical protein
MNDPLKKFFPDDPLERFENGMTSLIRESITDLCDGAWANADYTLLEQVAACSRRYPDGWTTATCATRLASHGQVLFAIPAMLAPGPAEHRLASLTTMGQILSTFVDPCRPAAPVTWHACDWRDFPGSLAGQREWLASRQRHLALLPEPVIPDLCPSSGVLWIGCGAGIPDRATSQALVLDLVRGGTLQNPVRVGALQTPWMARREVQMMEAVSPAWLAMVARKRDGHDLMTHCLTSRPLGDYRELTLADSEGDAVYSLQVSAVDDIPAEEVALNAFGAYVNLTIDQPVRHDIAQHMTVEFAVNALASDSPGSVSEGQRFVRHLAARGYQADLDAIATQLGEKGLSLGTLVPDLFN